MVHVTDLRRYLLAILSWTVFLHLWWSGPNTLKANTVRDTRSSGSLHIPITTSVEIVRHNYTLNEALVKFWLYQGNQTKNVRFPGCIQHFKRDMIKSVALHSRLVNGPHDHYRERSTREENVRWEETFQSAYRRFLKCTERKLVFLPASNLIRNGAELRRGERTCTFITYSGWNIEVMPEGKLHRDWITAYTGLVKHSNMWSL